MNYCFAYEKDDEGRFFCTALDTEVCPGKACHFYKTKKQCEEEKKKRDERLKRYPEEKQREIRKKYSLK